MLARRLVTVRLRTKNDLPTLLQNGESPAWRIAHKREVTIAMVEIVRFDGTQMIVGRFDPNGSWREKSGRLVVRFTGGRIAPCDVEFRSRNPVGYHGPR
jgi:hypothetical protein